MDNEIKDIMDAPWDYIASTEYMSWERFFTYLLVSKTEDTYLKYSKKALNPAYLQDNIEKKILYVMEKIDFVWKK